MAHDPELGGSWQDTMAYERSGAGMSASNHADTIRLAINAAGAEGHLVAGAWDALDALLAEVEQLRAALAQPMSRLDALDVLLAEVERLRAALERIATERRPDGTYNLSREACEQIAREAERAVRG